MSEDEGNNRVHRGFRRLQPIGIKFSHRVAWASASHSVAGAGGTPEAPVEPGCDSHQQELSRLCDHFLAQSGQHGRRLLLRGFRSTSSPGHTSA